MAYDEEIEQKITGRTFEECKEKLFSLYGKDYKITNKYVEWRQGGFLHLSKKPVSVVSYVVKSYSSEAEQLSRNRDAILENQKSSLISSQTKEIEKIGASIEELKEEMSRQIKNIAVQTQDKHESIQKIEEMLEHN